MPKETRQLILRLTAFGILFGILTCVFKDVSILSQTCVTLSAVSLLCAIGLRIRAWRERDPYSLEDLRVMVLEGASDFDDVPDVEDGTDVMCLCCGETYGSRFKICPRCNNIRK